MRFYHCLATKDGQGVNVYGTSRGNQAINAINHQFHASDVIKHGPGLAANKRFFRTRYMHESTKKQATTQLPIPSNEPRNRTGRDKCIYPEHIIQASLLSILHCNAASALSSARRLASSYEISSSSDGPGDSGRLAIAADFEIETLGDGTGAAEAVVAIETCLRGATSDSAEGAAAATGALAILAAAALSLTSGIVSTNLERKRVKLTLRGTSVDGELDSVGRGSSSEVVDTSLKSSLPSVEVHRCQLGE